MKYCLLSDLHIGFFPYNEPFPEAEILLLAGDIFEMGAISGESASCWNNVHDFFRRACDHFEKIFIIPGNHEYYGADIDSFERLYGLFLGIFEPKVTPMLMDSVILPDGTKLIATTLWTDFHRGDPKTMLSFSQMLDPKRIRSGGDPLSSAKVSAMNRKAVAWLEKEMAAADGECIVMTHHAPSYRSIHPRFKDAGPINGCFSSDFTNLMDPKVKVWVHGHTHDSFDYIANKTRILCNPLGYRMPHGRENDAFNPLLTFTI